MKCYIKHEYYETLYPELIYNIHLILAFNKLFSYIFTRTVYSLQNSSYRESNIRQH